MATVHDISAWLDSVKLGKYAEAFAKNDIGVDVLAELTDADLKELGVSLGDRKRMLTAIAAEGRAGVSVPEVADMTNEASSAQSSPVRTAERRQLTVMFVDLVGSTALSVRLDPEDLRELILAYQNAVAGEVSRFEGYIARYMGDGVLAYFGWPRAHEDDAERALRAGLAIVEAIDKLELRPEAALQVRIGVATGSVVVGDLVGEGSARVEDVIGETPNLAARLQSLAEPNGLVVASGTKYLAGMGFDYADLGEHTLKGFDTPVRAWGVLSARPLISRFESRLEALTPLAGRRAELSLLRDRWLQATRGEGQVVLISGEAGIGKSRIVHDLLTALGRTDVHLQRYQCSPYHTSTALHPFIDSLDRQLSAATTDDGKLERLLALAEAAGEEPARAVTLLAPLLSISIGERYPTLQLTPERRRQETHALLGRLALAGAARQAQIVVIEDVHWIDPSSLSLLSRLIDQLQNVAALLVLTARPEFDAPWIAFGHFTTFALNRLSRDQVLAMIDGITSGALPPPLRRHIVTRTDGVPLFVEEMTKALLESERDVKSERYISTPSSPAVVVPATLQDALMARLDRLTAAKEIAQIGAVIGREFPYRLVAAISALDENQLAFRFDQLVAAGLLFRRGTDPDATYVFKHALVRDVASQSLLNSRRRELHAKLANAFETRFQEVQASQPELIAYHLAQAGLRGKAAKFWIAAARRAVFQAAWHEASAFVEHGIAALRGQAETAEVMADTVDLYHLKYTAQYSLGNTGPLIATLEKAERIATDLDDVIRLSKVLSSQTYILSSNGEVAAAVAIGRRNVELISARDDLKEYNMAKFMLSRALYAAGQYAEAIQHVDEVKRLLGDDLVRGALDDGSLNQTVSARAWLVLFHTERGEFEQGQRLGGEALRLVRGIRESDHEHIWVCNAVGRLAVVKGDYGAGIEILEPVVPVAERGFPVYLPRVAASLGAAYAASGQVDRGLRLLRQAEEQGRSMRFQFGYALVLTHLAEALLAAGEEKEARDKGIRALETAKNIGERGNVAWAHCALGDISAHMQQAAGAENHYRQAVEIAEALAMVPVRARCSAGLQRLTRRQLK